MTIKATYVSVWDGGTRIETSCLFDVDSRIVFDIESSSVDGNSLDILDDEFIELPDGTEIRDFINEDDINETII